MKYILLYGMRQVPNFILFKHSINYPRSTFIRIPFPHQYLIPHLLSTKKNCEFRSVSRVSFCPTDLVFLFFYQYNTTLITAASFKILISSKARSYPLSSSKPSWLSFPVKPTRWTWASFSQSIGKVLFWNVYCCWTIIYESILEEIFYKNWVSLFKISTQFFIYSNFLSPKYNYRTYLINYNFPGPKLVYEMCRVDTKPSCLYLSPSLSLEASGSTVLTDIW